MQDQALKPPKAAPTGLEVMLTGQVQRVNRVLAFVSELVEQLQKDFGELWLEPPQDPALQRFVAESERLAARVEEGQKLLKSTYGRPQGEALKTIYAFGIDALASEAQALQQQARAMKAQRPRPAAPAPAPGPAAQPPGLAGLLRKFAKPFAAEEAPPPAPPPPDPGLAKAQQAFRAARDFVSGILAYVSPRMQLVAVALESTGLPGKKLPWPEVAKTLVDKSAGFDPSQRGWLPPLTKTLYEQPAATQPAHMAVVQWREAQALDVQAELLDSALETAPPPRQAQLLATFDAGKYQAAAFPLGHLHMRFRGTAPLDTLFPAPEKPAGAPTGRLGASGWQG